MEQAMQKHKIQKTFNPNRQSDNKYMQPKSHRRPNYTNTKSKSTNRNYKSINKRLFTSIASSGKAVRRSKKNETGKLPPNKLRIIYANARGIKSKIQSLK